MKFSILVLPLIAVLTACTKNIEVSAPNISATDLNSDQRIPGNYAVMIQSGGWQAKVKTSGYACSVWSFPTDFESGYVPAVQGAFEQSFAKVSFVQTVLKPDELLSQGFDGEIFVYEGSVNTNFSVSPNLFTVTMNATVSLDGIVGATDKSGRTHQGNVTGTGTGTFSTAFGGCGSVSNAIAAAGPDALKAFVINVVNAAKLDAMQSRLNGQQAISQTGS